MCVCSLTSSVRSSYVAVSYEKKLSSSDDGTDIGVRERTRVKPDGYAASGCTRQNPIIRRTLVVSDPRGEQTLLLGGNTYISVSCSSLGELDAGK